MKIALCQINPTLGDFQYNKKKILRYYNHSIKSGADIVIFPEMITTGYPPQDLLWNKNFIQMSLKTTKEIADLSSNPIIFGCIRKEKHSLYNSAAICSNGKIKKYIDKILLPTYDVFDESRYFSSGANPDVWDFSINGKTIRIGVQICEDLWDENYDCKVSEIQKNMGAEIIVNISASPFSKGKSNDRVNVIKDKVKITGLPFVYCNMVGAQDQLIYDGESLVVDGHGTTIAYLKSFCEDSIIVDINSKNSVKIDSPANEEKIYNGLVLGLKDYFYKTNHSEAVVGLSGGIDSALVCSIAVEALGSDKVHGISMPSKFSSDHSINDAEELARNLKIDYRVIPINRVVDIYDKTLYDFFHQLDQDTTEENIQARIRGNLLMALSNKFKWMVLSTGNKTELALGYCTLYGDMSGGISIISDLSKTDVYSLSKYINIKFPNRIPINTIAKIPSAELSEGQVDPFDYNIVSPLVDELIEGNKTRADLIEDGYDSELVDKISTLVYLNEYKRRQSAPGLKISKKAFGIGRRFPIATKFRG